MTLSPLRPSGRALFLSTFPAKGRVRARRVGLGRTAFPGYVKDQDSLEPQGRIRADPWLSGQDTPFSPADLMTLPMDL